MPSIIKVDQIQSDQGFVNVSSNLQFSSGFTMQSPTLTTPTITGQATIPTINLTGGQIAFPAAQNASSDANTLDDYEEGTWSPIIGGDGGQSGQSYGIRNGTYVKVGKIVVASFDATLSAKGTLSGTYVQIKGLPFTIQTTQIQSGCSLYFVNLTTNWITLGLQTLENSTSAFVWGMTAAAASRTYPAFSDIGNSTQLAGILVYQST